MSAQNEAETNPRMGGRNTYPEDRRAPIKLNLREVRLSGDYERGRSWVYAQR